MKRESTMRMIAVSSQMLSGRVPTLEGFSPTVGGYTVDLSPVPSGNAFEILEDLKKDPNTTWSNYEVSPEEEEFALEVKGVTLDDLPFFIEWASGSGLLLR